MHSFFLWEKLKISLMFGRTVIPQTCLRSMFELLYTCPPSLYLSVFCQDRGHWLSWIKSTVGKDWSPSYRCALRQSWQHVMIGIPGRHSYQLHLSIAFRRKHPKHLKEDLFSYKIFLVVKKYLLGLRV